MAAIGEPELSAVTQAFSAPACGALHLEIGGVPLSLQGADERLWRAAWERYEPFSKEVTGAYPIHVGPGEPAFEPSFRYRLNRGGIALGAGQAAFTGVQNVYELDSLLRILLSQVLVEQRGFLLHAATIERDGRAYIFMGRSGAGKSTVASKAPVGSVFTDEISLVRHRGRWEAHGTPFWGEFRADGQNRSAPLAGVFELVQAPQNRKEALPVRAALSALLGNTLFFSGERAARERLLGVYAALLQDVPVYRLEFRKDCSFWECIA